ncbi:MAG: CPBP family intramembrane glutamate endopeptidase, partial [Actinomycetota bacterium]|nr:CPBP family intramembrane glutamate endopeptidase [Actinomycetota bacterium]
MRQRLGAGGLAVVLVGWKLVTSRIPARWHPVPHVLFGTAVWALTGAPRLGLRPPALWAGLRWGAAAA